MSKGDSVFESRYQINLANSDSFRPISLIEIS